MIQCGFTADLGMFPLNTYTHHRSWGHCIQKFSGNHLIILRTQSQFLSILAKCSLCSFFPLLLQCRAKPWLTDKTNVYSKLTHPKIYSLLCYTWSKHCDYGSPTVKLAFQSKYLSRTNRQTWQLWCIHTLGPVYKTNQIPNNCKFRVFRADLFGDTWKS